MRSAAILFLLVFAPGVARAEETPSSGEPPAPLEPTAPPTPAEPEPPKNALVADLGQHVVGFGVQRTLAPWVSAQITLSYYQPWTQNIDFLGLSGEENKGGDLRGFISRGRAFFYPCAAAPSGLWISPFVQGGIGFGLRNDERRAGPVWAAGTSIGYSGILGRSVLLGGGLGAQYHFASIPGGSGPPSFSRFYPQVEIQLGYAF